jgi:D-glucosaminate-6-phosphate ammonia-lyase
VDIFSKLGITPIINGVGPATRLGGLPLSEGVWAAMRDSSIQSYRMDELHEAAGRYLAELLGIPGALVTAGASAALSLSTAVCIAGGDVQRIANLPHVLDRPTVVVIQKAHRDPYDHAITAMGATIREIGFPASTNSIELASALDSTVCAVLWRSGRMGDFLDLATCAQISHSFNIPVIVDAAMYVPPISRLQEYFHDGADYVAASGGKGFRGPHTSGLLFAQPQNIQRALLHHLDMDERPSTWKNNINEELINGLPRNGIARGMKVGREQIFGLIVAVEEYVSRKEHDHGAREIDNCEISLSKVKEISVTRVFEESLQVTNLHIVTNGEMSADEFYLRLASGTPRVILGQELAWKGILTMNPMALAKGDGVAIAEKIKSVMGFS